MAPRKTKTDDDECAELYEKVRMIQNRKAFKTAMFVMHEKPDTAREIVAHLVRLRHLAPEEANEDPSKLATGSSQKSRLSSSQMSTSGARCL